MAEKSSALGKDFILFANKASRLMDDGNVKQALNLCEAGVRHFPFYANGHYVLGLCYESMENLEDAKNEFERVILYDPSHSSAMRKLSEIYRKSGLNQVSDDFLIKEHLDEDSFCLFCFAPVNIKIEEIDISTEQDVVDGGLRC